MKNKVIASFLITSLIMTSLIGCGKDSSQETVTETEEAQAATQNGPVNLVLWGAEDDQELLASMVESFKAQYGSEANINIELDVQAEDSCKDKVLSDVEASADVFAFADDQLRTFVAAGALSPVPDADTVRAENIEGAVDASSVNGTLYAYPMTADNGYFMYYNKAYFSDDDVKTLDGMLEIAKENDKKITMDWTSAWYLYSFFGQTGLDLGLNDNGVTNHCNWNATDTAIKGVDVANAMLDIAADAGFKNGTDADLIEGAKNDTVIAGISGVWSSTALLAAWGNNLGAVKLPTYTCAEKQVQMASFVGYKMVAVNAYSKNTEWAHKLAQWITNEQNQTLRFQKRGQGPSNKNASSSGDVAASPAIQAVLAQSEYGVLQRIGESYWKPVAQFGTEAAEGKLNRDMLQDTMDKLVDNITAGIGM